MKSLWATIRPPVQVGSTLKNLMAQSSVLWRVASGTTRLTSCRAQDSVDTETQGEPYVPAASDPRQVTPLRVICYILFSARKSADFG
jgi:hypothetical protein